MGKKINQLPATPVLLPTDLCIVGSPIDGTMHKVSLKQLRDFIAVLFDPRTVDIEKLTDLYAFGDEFMLAANIMPTADAYISRFITAYNKKLNLFAETGRGVWKMVSSAYEKLPQVNSNVLTLVMTGLNDIRLAGTNAKTLEKIRQSYRSLIINQFLKTAIPASDASVTKTGTWKSTYNSSAIGGKAEYLGGKGVSTSTKKETLRWTFTGNNVVIGYSGSDGDAMRKQGSFFVSIDGMNKGYYTQNGIWDGVSDGSYDNTVGPAAILITGLSSGTHTLTIETQEDEFTVFDYFGTLKYPDQCNPLLIGQIPLMTTAGYKANAPYDKATEAAILQANTVIEEVVRDFTMTGGYPVAIVPINKAIQLPDDIDKDDVHWNNTGHQHVFNALQAVIR